MKKYDVLIVGSGLGGLVCGTVLSKEGYHVCVVEKNKQIGGCLQTFVRDGCSFDTGVHYIGGMDDGQVLSQYFKYLGILNQLKMLRLDETGFDIISFASDKTKYCHAIGQERFVETLLQTFPQEKTALQTYVKIIKEVYESTKLLNFNNINNSHNIENEYLSTNAHEFINSLTYNYKLRQVLAGSNSIYAGDANKTPFYMHALMHYSFIESAWRFVDGSQQIADRLTDAILQNGGDVLKEHDAVSFCCDSEKITHVLFKNDECIEAKQFISNIHPSVTLDLIDTNLIKKAYRNRIKGLENTISSFTVFGVLKEKAFPYFNSNYYHFKNTNVWDTGLFNETDWPKGFLFVTPPNSKSMEYADCFIAIAYMHYAEVQKWDNSTIENRGDNYKQFKKEKAEKLIDGCEQLFPGIRSKIIKYYTSSPLTYRDYTRTPNGSLYGVVRDCNNYKESYIAAKTRIPNLLFTGQNTNMHGVLGVTVGSILTCSKLIDKDNLIKKVFSV